MQFACSSPLLYSRACTPGLPRIAARSSRSATSTAPKSCRSLLDWATGTTQHSVVVEELLSGAGRGLVATEDIQPNEKILSVPFDKVYSSKPEDELEFHWSVDMALRLLRDKQACEGVASDSDGKWCEWLGQLPTHVLTPLEFTEEEVAAMGDDGLAAEVRMMQRCMEASYEVLQEELQAMGCSYQDFLAAVQVLHSRCFFQPETSCHMAGEPAWPQFVHMHKLHGSAPTLSTILWRSHR
ncbi:hypothetical protein DUNSADRAFT_4338 [Dunaliella salina]|uniref:Uncharacterized protein n=1 Tax=Dunaliella salina TaxID=3046 RepID=A0ABQ7H7Q9_DUNSA|nr:hypothetical protein DUNSADRAFT_4338 [Dunaliella salina]|eukprot:KAF5842880.1 hypothetical protein DUNSADRAFT_4338 [Dunaliella salina]